MPNSKPFFSIVIPSLNEEKYLPHLLSDLAKQTFDKNSFEVILVDGNSDDKTVLKAENFKTKLKLSIYSVKRRNVAYQRNFGAKKAKGKWVVFMDADDRLPNYFLDGLKYEFHKNKADLFTCWMDTSVGTQAEKTINRTVNLAFTFLNKIGVYAAVGAMIIASKKVIKTTKFPLKNRVAEDALFVETAVKNGFVFKVLTEPRYVFSSRRLRKEGYIRMLVIESRVALNYLIGDKFINSDVGYVMKGGGYYETNKSVALVHQLKKYLRKATDNQLTLARNILSAIDAID